MFSIVCHWRATNQRHRELQLRTHTHTHTKMAETRENQQVAGEEVDNDSLVCCQGNSEMEQMLGKGLQSYHVTRNFTFSYLYKRNENMDSFQTSRMNVHSNSLHNSQKDRNELSTKNKQCVAYMEYYSAVEK